MPFSQQTLDFLVENRLRDNRDWFQAHKAVYRQVVLDPLCELVEALSPCMLQIDPYLTTEPRVDKTICRIRRDTVRSHDKTLYRDTMWIIFKRGKMHGAEVPGIYFEITPWGFQYGCGFYHASPGYLQTMRDRILDDDPDFVTAQQAFLAQSVFQIEGECYHRPHYPTQPAPLRQWLERRNIGFIAESRDFPLLFSQTLASVLRTDFARLSPIYHFLLSTALAYRQKVTAQESLALGRGSLPLC